MIKKLNTIVGLASGIAVFAMVSGCGSRNSATAPKTQSGTVAQQQQQIQNNPNLSPEAKASASAAYASFANQAANSKPAP